MKESDWLAKKFQESRSQLRALACRMLGSSSEADDAIQEAWLRLTGTDAERIENLRGWLTTVVARVCLDVLRSRKAKLEAIGRVSPDRSEDSDSRTPESDVILADSVGPALLVVLDTLTPMERIAFVLHDIFDISFKEIGAILDRSEVAAKQLASRARRKVRGRSRSSVAEGVREREVVSAFLAASRERDFAALLRLLAPDATLYADATAVKIAARNRAKGAPPFEREIRGGEKVAETFKGRATGARLALINGHFGAMWAPGGKPVVAFLFTVEREVIGVIEVVMDPERLKGLCIEPVGGEP